MEFKKVQKPEQQYIGRLGYLAKLCGMGLDESFLEIMQGHLSDIPLERRILALDKIIATRKATDRFPSIRDIRDAAGERIDDGRDDKFAATEIAHSIWNAIGRFGSWRMEEARDRLGPIGWAVVECTGGWGSVCEALEFDKTTLLAQWRDIAMNMLIKQRQGIPLSQIPGAGPTQLMITDAAWEAAGKSIAEEANRIGSVLESRLESQNPAHKPVF